MPFKEVSSILADNKDSYSNNPYELFNFLLVILVIQFNTRFFISNPNFHFRPRVAKVVCLTQAKSCLVGCLRIIAPKKFNKATISDTIYRKNCYLHNFLFLPLPSLNNVEKQWAKLVSSYVKGSQHCIREKGDF